MAANANTVRSRVGAREAWLLAIGLVALVNGSSSAQTVAIKAKKLYPISGAVIENGIVLVRDGRIAAIGRNISIPSGVKVVSAEVAMPALVDPHSHLGCANETDEPVDAVTPDFRALDAFDDSDPSVRRALQAGIVTVGIAPGNGSVIGGQIGVVRLGARSQVLNGYAAQKLSISLDAAGPQRSPTSRAGAVLEARKALVSASSGLSTSSTRQTSLLVGEFPTNLGTRSAALQPVLKGSIPAFIHAPTAADAHAALELASDLKVRPVLVHTADAVAIMDASGRTRAPIIRGPLGFDSSDRSLRQVGEISRAGNAVAFCSDSPKSAAGSLRQTAHLAVKYGMRREAALRALTLTGAELLGVGRTTGSLEVGKSGDILLLNGDPLSLASRVEHVFAAGREVYRSSEP